MVTKLSNVILCAEQVIGTSAGVDGEYKMAFLAPPLSPQPNPWYGGRKYCSEIIKSVGFDQDSTHF